MFAQGHKVLCGTLMTACSGSDSNTDSEDDTADSAERAAI